MATDPNVHLRALKRATDAGDMEAADFIRGQLVKAYQDENADENSPATGGADVLGFHISNPTIARGVEGVGRGLTNVARQVGNMVGVIPDEQLKEDESIDKPLMDTTAGKVGNFIGETAATLPIAGGASEGVARLGAAGAKVASNLLARGAIEGAAQGAVMAGPGQRTAGAAAGAVAGTVLPAAGVGYRAARAGVRPTRAAQRLMSEGVDLTPGQMNPTGLINKVEQMPIVSDLTQPIRNRAEQQFQRATIQKAAVPGTNIAQGKADQMLDQAYQSFAPLYDQARGFGVNDAVLRRALGVQQPVPGIAALAKVFDDATISPAVRATDQTRTSVGKWLQNQLTAIRGRGLTSDDLLDLRSAIRTEARNARVSNDPQENAAAGILQRAEQALTAGIKSSISRPAQAALDLGDKHYSLYKVLEDAVSRAGDRPQGFTPNQLSLSVRSNTPKAAYARGGGGPLRDMSSAGREVFDPTEPKTGYALGKVGLAAAGAAAAPKIAIPAAVGAAGLIGTRVGRAVAAGRTRPQLLARELEREVRRTVPKEARETIARSARNSLVLANPARYYVEAMQNQQR